MLIQQCQVNVALFIPPRIIFVDLPKGDQNPPDPVAR